MKGEEEGRAVPRMLRLPASGRVGVVAAAVLLAAGALGLLIWALASSRQLAWLTSISTVLAVDLAAWTVSAGMLAWVIRSRKPTADGLPAQADRSQGPAAGPVSETRGGQFGSNNLQVNLFTGETVPGHESGFREVRAADGEISPRAAERPLAEVTDPSALGIAPDADLALPRHVIALIEDKTREFVGRDYVFDSIAGFLGDNPSGYFMLEGDPGTGKSSVLAEYVKRYGCVAHFNQRAEGITDFRQFLESIFKQLKARYRLPYQSVPPDAFGDGAFLSQLLQEAASKLSDGQRLVIAVDALDEVDLAFNRSGANILYLPSILPDGVYFVMTKRHLDLPLTVSARRTSYALEQDQEGTVRDISAYIRSSIRREGLEHWLSARGISDDDFVAALVDRSEGNFMYLRYVLPEIGSGVYDDLEIGVLPKGLQGYYDDHWRRMGMLARPLPRMRIRIIYILAEVKQPVSRRLIAQFATDHSLTVDELAVQEVLDDWSQFLHVQRRDAVRFSLYHASFRDFLHRKDVVQAAGVAVKDINAMIADDLWESLFGDPG
jgi:hypothetical protein